MIVAGSASAYTVHIDIDSIQHLFTSMKEDTKKKLYPTKPLKDQMRGEMMMERSSKNYMQDVIQGMMMVGKSRDWKPEQMQRMVELIR